MQDNNLYNVPRQEKLCTEIQPFLNITDSVEESGRIGPGRDQACTFLDTVNQLVNTNVGKATISYFLSNLCSSSSVHLGFSPSMTVTALYHSFLQLSLDL